MSAVGGLAFALATAVVVGALGAWASPASADEAMVSIQGHAYEPATVTVTAGDTVVWQNNEILDSHTVTADDGSFDSHPAPACNRLLPFLSNCLKPGAPWEHQFTQPGTYGYHCEIHQWMHGTVEVLPAAAGTPPAPPPPTQPPTTSPPTTTPSDPTTSTSGPTTTATTEATTSTTSTTAAPSTTAGPQTSDVAIPRDRQTRRTPLVATPPGRATAELAADRTSSEDNDALFLAAIVAGSLIVATALGATILYSRGGNPAAVPVLTTAERIRLRRRRS